jgi:hypothetical protein
MTDEPIDPKPEDEYFVFTLTAKQRKQVIEALVKIAIGIILLIAGYFLPHSQ